MGSLTFRPIQSWPGKLTKDRRKSPFHTGLGRTYDRLDKELRHLGGTAVVLQVALPEQDIKIDGRPRQGAKFEHPGVILTFESRHGTLNYPCDTYGHWQDNLHAIVLALEALRAIDRYGVTVHGEQYRGFAALPPAPGGAMSWDQAWEFMKPYADHAGKYLGDPDGVEAAYKKGAFALHPDRGGDGDQFKKLQQAKEILLKRANGGGK